MKKTVKRFVCFILTFSLLCATSLFFSCNRANEKNDRIKILCTVFPVYDWVKNIVGNSDSVEVDILVKNGTDLHSFQPSFGDMAKIKDSDVVIYIGGESDKWVADSIDERSLGISLSAVKNVSLYEVTSSSIISNHSHNGEECHEVHEHSHGFDEHIWLSVKNAIAVCNEILSVICEIDESNEQFYKQNAAAYIQSLNKINERMETLSKNINGPLIFADRFPFVYLLLDYNIPYFAAFEGCSTDTNADFNTVIALSKKMDEHSATHIFTTERPIIGLADNIISQTKFRSATVISLDSMQSTAISDKPETTSSYLSVMDKNISLLEQAFN